MPKYYILLSDYSSFEKGSILWYKSDEYTDFDTDTKLPVQVSDIILEIENVRYEELKNMSKEQRLKAYIKENGESKTELIHHVPSNIFLRQDSNLNNMGFNKLNEETKSKLYQVQLNKDIFGTVINKCDNYYAMELLPASKEMILTHSPDCHFNNHFFDKDHGGIIVNTDFLKEVPGNLVFHKNRSIINEKMIMSKEDCQCSKFNRDEYAKFIDGTNKMIAQIQSCSNINGQHCLRVKFVKSDATGTEDALDEGFIRDLANIKIGLKNITTYFDGVIIDPTCIVKMENCEYNNRNIKLDDPVEVTLRDSGETYGGIVIWLGKVNDIEVAAVKSEGTISNRNLSFGGTFQEVEYFDKDAYIVPISITRKISAREILTPQRISEIAKSLKASNVTEGVQKDLTMIYDFFCSVRSPSTDITKEFLNLSKTILKRLREDFISPRLNNVSTIVVADLDNNEQVLLNCSLKLMEILCDLCASDSSFVGEISIYVSLRDIFETILIDIDDSVSAVAEMRQLYSNIMIIIWFIIKYDYKKSSKWNTKMTSIFLNKSTDENIRLISALCLPFLMKTNNEKDAVVSYLKNSYKNLPPSTGIQRVTKNDILLAIGKIFESEDVSITSNQSGESMTSPSFPNESDVGFAFEETLEDKYKLSVEDYEDCIEIFATEDKSPESVKKNIIYIAKLNNKKVFPIFIGKQNPIPFKEYPKVINEIIRQDDSCKAFLEKCVFEKENYKSAVKIANDFLIKKNISMVKLILDKIAPLDEDLDASLLALGVQALRDSEFDILTLALTKCTDVNSYMSNGETFITNIILEKLDEEKIIQAIQCNDQFDINKKNRDKKMPIQMASRYKLETVYKFLCKKKVDFEDLFGQI